MGQAASVEKKGPPTRIVTCPCSSPGMLPDPLSYARSLCPICGGNGSVTFQVWTVIQTARSEAIR